MNNSPASDLQVISLISNLFTYIHNWPLQPFSQDFGLASHTTHVVCVIRYTLYVIRKWRDLQFNVHSQLQIFEKRFHGRFIYSQSFCQKFAERKSPKKYFIFISFLITDLGYEPRLLNLISRHTTYQTMASYDHIRA